jgi:hypothetical protein
MSNARSDPTPPHRPHPHTAQPYQVWGTRSPKHYSYRNSQCICAQVLNCANGCAVCYFLPSHTKSGGQGLPRTIAIANSNSKCICAQVLNCANGCAVYYFLPSHTKSGGQGAMSSERDSFAKGIFSTFAKGFLLHKLLLKVNYSPLRVKKSRSHDMGQGLPSTKAIAIAIAIADAFELRY